MQQRSVVLVERSLPVTLCLALFVFQFNHAQMVAVEEAKVKAAYSTKITAIEKVWINLHTSFSSTVLSLLPPHNMMDCSSLSTSSMPWYSVWTHRGVRSQRVWLH
jgi:hypothetical protein